MVAGSDRIDTNANQLWASGNRQRRALALCAAGRDPCCAIRQRPSRRQSAEGHITQGEVAPEVVVSCEGQILRINPMTGPPLIME